MFLCILSAAFGILWLDLDLGVRVNYISKLFLYSHIITCLLAYLYLVCINIINVVEILIYDSRAANFELLRNAISSDYWDDRKRKKACAYNTHFTVCVCVCQIHHRQIIISRSFILFFDNRQSVDHTSHTIKHVLHFSICYYVHGYIETSSWSICV